MFKFELNNEMLAVIEQALMNAPYRVAAPVLVELQRQVEEQKTKPIEVPKQARAS